MAPSFDEADEVSGRLPACFGEGVGDRTAGLENGEFRGRGATGFAATHEVGGRAAAGLAEAEDSGRSPVGLTEAEDPSGRGTTGLDEGEVVSDRPALCGRVLAVLAVGAGVDVDVARALAAGLAAGVTLRPRAPDGRGALVVPGALGGGEDFAPVAP